MTKWHLVILVGVFCLVAAAAGAERAEASCAGTDCCCDIEQNECEAGCPGYGQPGHLECFGDCRRGYQRCGICCCSQCWEAPPKYECQSWQPPPCGGSLLSEAEPQDELLCSAGGSSIESLDRFGWNRCIAPPAAPSASESR